MMMAIVRMTDYCGYHSSKLTFRARRQAIYRNSRQFMVGQTLWYLNNKSICKQVSTTLPPVAIDFDLNVKGGCMPRSSLA